MVLSLRVFDQLQGVRTTLVQRSALVMSSRSHAQLLLVVISWLFASRPPSPTLAHPPPPRILPTERPSVTSARATSQAFSPQANVNRVCSCLTPQNAHLPVAFFLLPVQLFFKNLPSGLSVVAAREGTQCTRATHPQTETFNTADH